MKNLLTISVLLLCFALQGRAQEFIWGKSYGWHREESVSAIITLPDGFMAAGGSDTFGCTWHSNYYANGWDFYPKSMLIRLNTAGDTLFTLKLNFWGAVGNMKLCPDGNLLAAVCGVDTPQHYFGIRLFKVTPDGQVLWQRDIADTKPYNDVSGMCITPDGGVLLVGGKTSDPGTGGTSDGYAIRVNENGDELWRKAIRPNTQTYLHYAEMQNFGNGFLVSGAAGSQIYAAWLDSAGNVTRQQAFWSDPQHTGVSYFSWVMQSPDSSVIACGNNSSFDTLLYFLGKFDLQGNKLWADTFYGQCRLPVINSEGYIFLSNFYAIRTFTEAHSFYITKFTPTGYQVGSLRLNTDSLSPKILSCAAWLNNDSIVFAGQFNGPNRSLDFYFTKIAGTGNGYVASVPPLVSEPLSLTLYPNPATHTLNITALPSQSVPLFYNTLGQLLQVPMQSKPGLWQADVQSLPKGLYLVQYAGQVGKVVKE